MDLDLAGFCTKGDFVVLCQKGDFNLGWIMSGGLCPLFDVEAFLDVLAALLGTFAECTCSEYACPFEI